MRLRFHSDVHSDIHSGPFWYHFESHFFGNGLYEKYLHHVRSLGPQANETCHIYDWVMSHMTTSHHMSPMSTSCHIWPSYVTWYVTSHITKPCQLSCAQIMYDWVTSRVSRHIWLSHVNCTAHNLCRLKSSTKWHKLQHMQHIIAHCNTLQHPITHCNRQQHNLRHLRSLK